MGRRGPIAVVWRIAVNEGLVNIPINNMHATISRGLKMIVEKNRELNQARRGICIIDFPDRKRLKRERDRELEREINRLEKVWRRQKYI